MIYKSIKIISTILVMLINQTKCDHLFIKHGDYMYSMYNQSIELIWYEIQNLRGQEIKHR